MHTTRTQKIALLLFGIFVFLFLLESGLRISGYILTMKQRRQNRINLQENMFRILCLGESTTAGQYPRYLQNTLDDTDTGIQFTVIDEGVNGTDTATVVSRLPSLLDKYNPHLVITMIGINDGADTIKYKNTLLMNSILYIQHFRIYKLSKLIWQHVAYQIKQFGSEAYAEDGSISNAAEENTSHGTETGYDSIIEKGEWLINERQFGKAEVLLKKVLRQSPENKGALIALAWCYRSQAKYAESAELYEKVLATNDNTLPGTLFHDLAWCYAHQKKFDQAAKVLLRCIEKHPDNGGAYEQLAGHYYYQGSYKQASEMYKKAIEMNPLNSRQYGGLALCYEKLGEPQLAKKYFAKANTIRNQYHNPITEHNYRVLYKILHARNIQLVCMQYPMRDTSPLHKIFADIDNIIFVDNETIFKNAVEASTYEDYFVDNFAGDFGHCSEKGNELLAENITRVLLKEYFDISQE